jgi:hypothetical protein
MFKIQLLAIVAVAALVSAFAPFKMPKNYHVKQIDCQQYCYQTGGGGVLCRTYCGQ